MPQAFSLATLDTEEAVPTSMTRITTHIKDTDNLPQERKDAKKALSIEMLKEVLDLTDVKIYNEFNFSKRT